MAGRNVPPCGNPLNHARRTAHWWNGTSVSPINYHTIPPLRSANPCPDSVSYRFCLRFDMRPIRLS